MGLVGTIIVGFLVGMIAKLIMPGKKNMGFIVTTLLGVAGAFVATHTRQAAGWYQAGEGTVWIGFIRRRVRLLFTYNNVQSRPRVA